MVRRSTLTNEQTVDAILDEVQAAEPDCDRDAVRETVLKLATLPEKRTMLLQHFDRFPDLLTSGDSRIPRMAQRFIEQLAALGVTAVVRPRCALCQRVKPLPRVLPDGHRACATCGRQRDAKPCSRCGRVRTITRRTDQEQLCLRCYRHDPVSHKTCSSCGRSTYAVTRAPSGPLCTTCAPRTQQACGQCGHVRRIRGEFLGGPLCQPCHETLRRNPGTCPECATIKILAYLTEHDHRICASCAGHPSPFACHQCGREDHQYGRRCAVCVLTDRATALLSDSNGELNTVLSPVLAAFLAVDRPKSTLAWLQRSQGPRVLRRMALGELEITHAALDGLPRTKAIDYLRDFLTAVGVLPAQHVHLERFSPWLSDILTGLPGEHVQILRPYANWQVLRRLRTKANHDQLTAQGARNARAQVRTASHFLGWLADRGKALPHTRQADLDEYLIAHASRLRHLYDFIAWTHARRLSGDLRLPKHNHPEPEVTLADDDRWHMAERLLHEETLDLDVRVAGLFILLYGQPLARVCRMKPEQITQNGDHVTVRFAEDPVTLPQPLDGPALALLDRRGRSSYESRPTRWLFPGGSPGRHREPETLRLALAKADINIRPTRNAALLQLAGELPAPVLADLLGLSPTTAVRWAALAARDWSSYMAATNEAP